MNAALILLLLTSTSLTLAHPVPTIMVEEKQQHRQQHQDIPSEIRSHPVKHASAHHHPDAAAQALPDKQPVLERELNVEMPAAGRMMMLFGSSVDDDAVFHKLMEEWKDK